MDGPDCHLYEGALFGQVKTALAAGDPRFLTALEQLREEADAALESGLFSVTYKSAVPPSGSKHDYMSVGPYWWPNPDSEDGLPYLRKDGQINPMYYDDAYDAIPVREFNEAWQTLAAAYYFTEDERYAEHAADLLRTWFLDPETRMHPNLNFGQHIPGRTEGRREGIVEVRDFLFLPDSIALLRGSPHLTEADEAGLRDWCSQFLDWMLESDTVADYRAVSGGNNISNHFDAVLLAFAYYSGRPEVARKHLDRVAATRIDKQINAEGKMPAELRRTLGFAYTVGALSGLFQVARLAEHVDVDLWHYEAPGGGSLRAGLDYILPYLYEPDTWPHQQIRHLQSQPYHVSRLLLPFAARAWEPEDYLEAFAHLEQDRTLGFRQRLLYPSFLLHEPKP
jgi:hypothetical protein